MTAYAVDIFALQMLNIVVFFLMYIFTDIMEAWLYGHVFLCTHRPWYACALRQPWPFCIHLEAASVYLNLERE